jgi:hypothetical protein
MSRDFECPTCGSLAVACCRCFRRDSVCAKGHEWHFCEEHGSLVLGPSDHASPGCSCQNRDLERGK